MVTWAFEFENTDAFEGFRSLATDGIDKPILNFFRMAGLMSGERVATTSTGATPFDHLVSSGVPSGEDVDAMATHAANSAAVLLWNYQESATPGPTAPVALTIHNLPITAKRVLVQQYRIDATHSNAYTVWQSMGSPTHPTPQQIAQLEACDGLQLLDSPAWLVPSKSALTLRLDLPVESVALISVRWTP
jgi:xylan 1,4-beta-xylosidase